MRRLFVVLGGVIVFCLACGARPVQAEEDLERLIDQLIKIAAPGTGYSVYFSGSDFAPYDDCEEIGTGVLGAMGRSKSPVLKEIVSRGAAAVPVLVKHLGDERKIEMKPVSGMMWMGFAHEYDFNSRTQKSPAIPEPKGMPWPAPGTKTTHAVTVGDLCFVALGQIVNRNFSATRYQSSGGLVVNSPTHSQPLRDVARADWQELTPAKHKALLIQDFVKPDYETRRIGAYRRLALYYPETVEELVLAELKRPTYDSVKAREFCQETLYKAKTPEDRKRLYDEYVRVRGPQYAAGVEQCLYDDLEYSEMDAAPRELLIQLFGAPAKVKGSERPWGDVASNYERERFVEALTHDPSRKIGDVLVEAVRTHPNDRSLASACYLCLANRGYGEFLVSQLGKMDLASNKTPGAHNEELRSVSRSREKPVQDYLLHVVETTENESYFLIAAEGLAKIDDALLLKHAARVLKVVPVDSGQGEDLLEMLSWRFPDKARPLFQEYLAGGNVHRAWTVCNALWYGNPLAKEILATLLDDTRTLTGFDSPIRVCDRAAEAMSHLPDSPTRFDSDWSEAKKDAALLKLKEFSAPAKK